MQVGMRHLVGKQLWRRGYQLIQILSIDVAIGAVASGSILVWWLGISMPWIWWIALPSCVWLIYTLDHLLDARRLKGHAHTARHQFHYAYRKIIWIGWLSVALATLVLCLLYLPGEFWVFGSIMSFLVLGHLLLVWIIGNNINRVILKEFAVGLIYTVGVWGGPVLVGWKQVGYAEGMLSGQFFLLVMINLICFSLFEFRIDELDKQASFARAVGKKQTNNILKLCFFLVFILSIYFLTLFVSERAYLIQLTLIVMAFAFFLILWKRDWFVKHERYRILADGVFLLPAWVWLC